MKIRAVVLTAMTPLLIGLPIFSQPEELPEELYRTHFLTVVNDPNMPFVKVLLVIEDGKTLVKLQNGFHKTVQLKEMFIASNGMKA